MYDSLYCVTYRLVCLNINMDICHVCLVVLCYLRVGLSEYKHGYMSCMTCCIVLQVGLSEYKHGYMSCMTGCIVLLTGWSV